MIPTIIQGIKQLDYQGASGLVQIKSNHIICYVIKGIEKLSKSLILLLKEYFIFLRINSYHLLGKQFFSSAGEGLFSEEIFKRTEEKFKDIVNQSK